MYIKSKNILNTGSRSNYSSATDSVLVVIPYYNMIVMLCDHPRHRRSDPIVVGTLPAKFSYVSFSTFFRISKELENSKAKHLLSWVGIYNSGTTTKSRLSLEEIPMKIKEDVI
ncbi:hypothetical protein BHYA_0047g00270 [Botrytis hyacinthi]|uniref:Uncharacterized protein n=1 Tax=Botrytis hyacinthi TaxID=278943 RepID=A0A4Z1H3E7_9HELO|nr:hypothetical protein BHYA_0047g00270 [Botrytis hyacinthi]